MDGYLTKPLTLDRLRETVERWMSAPTGAPPPGAVAASESHSPIDRAVVAQMFSDNSAMIDRLLARFSQAGAKLVAEIVVAAADPQCLADLAHKLKGAARVSRGGVGLRFCAISSQWSGLFE